MTNDTKPTAEEKLAKVKEWIVKACPDIEEDRSFREMLWSKHQEGPFVHRPLTLEDVLRACHQNIPLRIIGLTDRHSLLLSNGAAATRFEEWQLGLPLDQQEPPVIDFLFSLLPQ